MHGTKFIRKFGVKNNRIVDSDLLNIRKVGHLAIPIWCVGKGLRNSPLQNAEIMSYVEGCGSERLQD